MARSVDRMARWGLLLSVCWLAAAHGQPAATAHEVLEELDVRVPMRDGVELSANVFRPAREGAWPAILMRTPYGNGGAGNEGAHYYARRGYAVVVQDTRGRFESGGVFRPFEDEAEDGFDTAEWMAAQPWCNGRIGTTGASYLGISQWLPAPLASPHVVSMFPMIASGTMYEDMYLGGAFQLALYGGWVTLVTVPEGEDPSTYDWPTLFRRLPLATWDRGVGRQIPQLREWLAHPDFGEHWHTSTVSGRYGQVEAVAHNLGGWYDIFAAGTVRNYAEMSRHGRTRAIRAGQRLVMGPWAHGISKDGRVGDMEFGTHAFVDIRQLESRWLDCTLKGLDTGVADDPPVRLFVMGENAWRDEREWPLARTRYTEFYLHSEGAANTRDGDGSLTREAPGDEPPDAFTYDPADPVPTAGGNNLIGIPAGPRDQREVETREDVLVYSTPVLEQAVELTGPIRMVLYAASSARDTDFTAKLVDVHPTGYAQNLADGIVRARYRESRANPTLIRPDEVYRYEIDVGVTSNLFHAGHRIRIDISSSNFPRFDRNPNTGHPFGQDDQLAPARQSVFHDAAHPSHALLPVIPRQGTRPRSLNLPEAP